MNLDFKQSKVLQELPFEDFKIDYGHGVYLLMNGDDVVYAGQSKKIINRIGDHLCSEKRHEFSSVKYAKITGCDLDFYERLLINHFQPKLNWTHTQKAKEARVGNIIVGRCGIRINQPP